MPRKLGIAVIGLGPASLPHSKSLLDLAGRAEVRWAVSRTPDRAEAYAAQFPFPTTTDLQPYAPEFVRGWTVERYQVDLRQAATLNLQTMEQEVRELCGKQVPGDTYRNLQRASQENHLPAFQRCAERGEGRGQGRGGDALGGGPWRGGGGGS